MKSFALAALLSVSTIALAACGESATQEAPIEDTAAAEPATDATATAEASAVLNANDATLDQLTAVEGVTPELAQAIIDGRPYASVIDLAAVLGDNGKGALSGVFVPVNLNTATKEELQLIPGMTPKMEHEFEEYRPYADMGQFDREIGKYVDEAEVARFRQYVTL